MNRFTRNNLLLIVIIVCSCLTAVGLFIFAIIRFFAMNKCMVEINEISKKVNELSRKNPRPHLNNKGPIEKNIALYKKTTDQLSAYFQSPMRKVAEEFVLGLKEKKPQKDVPLTVEQFRKYYEEMWNSGTSYVDKQYNYNNFREERFTNWNAQVAKYLPLAQKWTVEPLTEETLPEVLFSYIGIPRIMGEQPAAMVRFLKNYQSALVNLMSGVKYNTMGVRVDWFGFDADPTASQIASKFNSPRDHYPRIVAVWDIFGDVIKRMTSCSMMISFTDKNGKKCNVPYNKEIVNRLSDSKIPFTTYDDNVDTFHGLVLRAVMGSSSGGNNSSNNAETFRNAINGVDEGPFRVYRLRLTVSASLEGVRTLIRALEDAYKIAPEGAAYRKNSVYVVRSVALYAERDGAAMVFQAKEEEANPELKKQQQTLPATQVAPRGRGRGRGRSVEAEAAPRQSKADAAEREKALKDQAKEYEKLPYYDRPGYGDVLIGDDKTCKAVIDFDCFQLK
ncbi:MAG: hypothetical protein IJV93_00680 [Lentisphaeria bacterium]|nr:hypothetical protein [Lentisphaeria bacterium]